MSESASTPEQLFDGYTDSLAICRGVEQALSHFDEVRVKVTKSQVAFRRRKAFAFLWRPGQYISSGVPAVLSIALPCEVQSRRLKEVAHPAPKVWMHHLELRDVNEVDEQVCDWLAAAYDAAG